MSTLSDGAPPWAQELARSYVSGGSSVFLLYGNVHEKIQASLAGATEEQRRRILWENAAELYRVEEPA